jgi:hypothetical protein
MIEYAIETSLHLIHVRVNSSVHFLDFVNFFARFQKDPECGPALKSLLIVDSGARLVHIEPPSLRSFFHKVQEMGGPEKWAIVLSNATHASLFSGALQGLPSSGVQFRMFDDEFSALRWLKSE